MLRRKKAPMTSIDKALAGIRTLTRKFEGLLDANHLKAHRASAKSGDRVPLRELRGFGSNPGNLRMWAHVPEHLPSLAPLVVALHGCDQNAAVYSHGAGWSSLADRMGFAVVYPEQQPANNPKNCFSWFLPGDITRGHGEALSIQQMVEHAIATFGVDRRRVFITGLSAGGAMAAVMLATYPEVFAGGAIIAGLPYGCAKSVQEAFEAMFTDQSPSAPMLGDRVRAASDNHGPWPRISVWYGTADPIVKPSNSENIIRQWTDVHGLSAAPSHVESIGSHTRRTWNDLDGNTLIEAFSISGMGHGVPLDSVLGVESCGAPGPFFLDAGISSTHHIAGFWDLGDDLLESAHAPDLTSQPPPIHVGSRAVVKAETVDDRIDSDEAPTGLGSDNHAPRPYDPTVVIAAALKAAGLPVPKFPAGSTGGTAQFAPGPIIEAALKAAGLKLF
jgi:poly(hydroxyalkanoate) depolymerase family esterase